MAKVLAKGAVILVDDSAGTPRDISADVVSYEIKQSANKVEVTGMTEGSHNFIPGEPTYEVTLDVKWNSAATTGGRTVLQGILLSTTSKTVKITPESGGQYFSGEFMLDALNPKGAVAGAIELGSAQFSVMGATAPSWT
jgi:hypothetical protein